MEPIKNWKNLTNEEKAAEVRKIAELRGVGYSWDEIGEFYDTSSKTIRDYFDNHKVRKNAELAESIINGTAKPELGSIIVELLDRMNDMEAKFKTLEAEVIKTNVISTNSITSSKKYKVVYGDDREPVFCDYLELPKALPILAGNSSRGFYNMFPEERIDRNIKKNGKFNVRPDCAYVVYTTEKTFEDMHQQMINASDDNAKESDKQIDDMQRRLFGYTGSDDE